MSRYIWCTLLALGFAVAVFCVVSIKPNFADAVPPSADTPRPASVSAEVALATGKTTVQGEPMLLHYKISNSSDEEAWVSMGLGKNAWLSENLVDASGQNLPSVTEAPPIRREGLQPPDGVRVQAHSSSEGYVVASKPLVFPKPGTYTLSVHLRAPYSMGSLIETLPRNTLERPSSATLTQDYTFDLNVLPPDVRRLQRVAEAYRMRAANDKAIGWSPALVEALFSLPENVALPSWQALAFDPKISSVVRSHIAAQLSRVHSLASADLLAEMIWNPTQPTEVVTSSGVGARLLAEMYHAGDANLKQRIKKIYADRGMAAPEKPVGSLYND